MRRPCFARCRSRYETKTPLIQTRPCVGSCDADTSGLGLSCRASIAEAQRHGEGRAGTLGLHAVKGTPGRVRKSLSSLIQTDGSSVTLPCGLQGKSPAYRRHLTLLPSL